MKQGLIGSAIEEQEEGDGYSDSEDRKLAPAEGEGEGEGDNTPDDQYEVGVEAVMTMASRALKTPDIKQRVAQIVGMINSPQAAIEMANLTYDVLVAIDDKSRGTIPEDVLMGGALATLGMLAELVEAPPGLIAAASQSMLARYLEENGGDPGQVQELLGKPDPQQVTAEVERGGMQEE